MTSIGSLGPLVCFKNTVVCKRAFPGPLCCFVTAIASHRPSGDRTSVDHIVMTLLHPSSIEHVKITARNIFADKLWQPYLICRINELSIYPPQLYFYLCHVRLASSISIRRAALPSAVNDC